MALTKMAHVCTEGLVQNVINRSMPMMTTLTSDTAEAMGTQVVHLLSTAVTGMGTAEGGA